MSSLVIILLSTFTIAYSIPTIPNYLPRILQIRYITYLACTKHIGIWSGLHLKLVVQWRLHQTFPSTVKHLSHKFSSLVNYTLRLLYRKILYLHHKKFPCKFNLTFTTTAKIIYRRTPRRDAIDFLLFVKKVFRPHAYVIWKYILYSICIFDLRFCTYRLQTFRMSSMATTVTNASFSRRKSMTSNRTMTSMASTNTNGQSSTTITCGGGANTLTTPLLQQKPPSKLEPNTQEIV